MEGFSLQMAPQEIPSKMLEVSVAWTESGLSTNG